MNGSSDGNQAHQYNIAFFGENAEQARTESGHYYDIMVDGCQCRLNFNTNDDYAGYIVTTGSESDAKEVHHSVKSNPSMPGVLLGPRVAGELEMVIGELEWVRAESMCDAYQEIAQRVFYREKLTRTRVFLSS